MGGSGECFQNMTHHILTQVKRNAVQAIDTILRSRGHLNLIAGQPLLPLVSDVAPQKSKRPKTTNGASSSSAGPSTSHQKLAKPQPTSTCVLCDKLPYHSLKDCPKVLAGSVRHVGVDFEWIHADSSCSIARQIRLLEGKVDPLSIQMVAALRKLQRKAAARELHAGIS